MTVSNKAGDQYLEDQGFAVPIEHSEFSTLNWIKDVDTWQSKDWQRWRDGKIWEKFKRRDGYTCTYEFTYAFSYDTLVRRGYHDNNDCTDANNRHFGTNRVGCYYFDNSNGYTRFSLDHATSTVENRYGVFDIRSFCTCVDNH
ncbi:hypothetical protein I4U23_000184 [Adineta vaga]|nr:hypothetical protein I4U23_000184 [Adineta vaga]